MYPLESEQCSFAISDLTGIQMENGGEKKAAIKQPPVNS